MNARKNDSNRLVCCDEDERRRRVRHAPSNGLDWVEVGDDPRVLTIYFLGAAPEGLSRENVRIEGGARIRDIAVTGIEIYPAPDEDHDGWMEVRLDRAGDFSTYRLCVTELDRDGEATGRPPRGFDARYACVEFTFEQGGPRDLDCATPRECPPTVRERPELSYLSKDYATFRTLILDRLALLMPEWTERHVPDIGITLVELLAYVGDHLSYYQDAVATEAYLDTARKRVSVRRHVRLVDYAMHEGCNARTWIAYEVSEHVEIAPDDVYFLTHADDLDQTMLREENLPRTQPAPWLVFEPLVPTGTTAIVLEQAHNTISFYTWLGAQCCLAQGAMSATLVDPGVKRDRGDGDGGGKGDGKGDAHGKGDKDDAHKHEGGHGNDEGHGEDRDGERGEGAQQYPHHDPDHSVPPDAEDYALHLAPCDVLIFEEVMGPKTGNPADASPAHRHAVRLTKVTRSYDPLRDPKTGGRTLLVEIEWGAEDALPFPLCLSSVGPDCNLLVDVSVAHGNVVLVDHGRSVTDDFGPVPTVKTDPGCCDDCEPREIERQAGPFGIDLPRPDLTFAEPLPPCRLPPSRCGGERYRSAASLMRQDPQRALPELALAAFPAAPDGEPAFAAADLVDPTRLARSVAKARDVVDESTPAAWLRTQLRRDERDGLDAWNASGPTAPLPPEVAAALMHVLLGLRRTWSPVPDLLASGPDDAEFVVEMDDERVAHVRFGDGANGAALQAGETFRGAYRVGTGPVGNIGAGMLRHIVFRRAFRDGMTIVPHQYLPATGGRAPESVVDAKLLAPHRFRQWLARAITAQDYADIVVRDFPLEVQRAAAELRWSGSGAEVLVAVDARGVTEADAVLLCRIAQHLEAFRRIDHDVRVVAAHAVPLSITMDVSVRTGYLAGHVKAALLRAFGTGLLADGRRAYFHPDELTFGQSIDVSRLVAVAQAVPGVASVRVTVLERLLDGPRDELAQGFLALDRLEVPRLDNDPNFPERGQLVLTVEGR